MKIAVAGTGYVGLVTGACLSEIGHNVTCVDIDENKVTMMKEGISPIYEPGLDELLKKNHDEGRLNFTTDYKNAYKNHCIKCNKEYPAEYVFNSTDIPICICGGLIKPNVVLYGEMLPDDFNIAIDYISKCDLLIVAGTSLTVEPASSLINYFHGKNLVIINNDNTSYDNKAALVINDDLSKVFNSLT